MENLRKKLFRFYYRVEGLLAPGLRNAQFAYLELLKTRLARDIRWLDIGCGRRLYPEWMPNAEKEQAALQTSLNSTFGLDPDIASLRDNHFVRYRVAGDSGSLPFADASFDLLTANMVVEHVAEPRALLCEVSRVLTPNGMFLFHTPNALSYATLLTRLVPETLKVRLINFLEDRKPEDVFPTLYRMNTPGRIVELSRSTSLQLVELNHVESSAQAVMLGPLVVFELLWIRLLRLSAFRNLRSNLIVLLQKPA
jgi:ubiquinone/menaquinone biosynthesis C-methylase UbiE